MSAEDAVRKASKNFYDALNRMANGKKGAMVGIWEESDAVTAMHPIGGRDIGWKAVGSSFDQVAGAASEAEIQLADQQLRVSGDFAYEIGIERGSFTMAGQKVSIEQRVTNIYRREDGGWKVVHHHADISPEMIEIVKRL
jgi:ketosteroid isomerase-like protein